ncbi:MAG: Uma2 family endonuclease [Myxococcota bacterium]
MDNPAFQRRRLTVDDVLRMVKAGALDEDEPLELLDGDLIVVSPQGPLHRGLTVLVHQALVRTFSEGHHVQDHSPIVAGEHNMPEPDCTVIRGSAADFLEVHPTGQDVVIAVELSVTSQALDRAKAVIYAAAGVPCYCQVDVPARRATVFTAPREDAAEYSRVALLVDGEGFEVEGRRIELSDLLPPR